MSTPSVQDRRLQNHSASEPLESVAAAFDPAPVVTAETVDSAPGGKGAYALIMHLAEPVTFSWRQEKTVLDAGWYAYAGSAYGPGGIRARLRRHFRREKKPHWHVDALTVLAGPFHAVALEGRSECGIVSRLMRSGQFRFPLDGFGSSDCRSCRSHLLQWHRGI